MAWYDKYLTIYDKPFDQVPESVVSETRSRLAALQSSEPLASIVIIAYYEEKHLQACLWSLSEMQCRYPVEIIGVDNDSNDRTREIYEKSGIPYYVEYRHSCGYARNCGMEHSRGKYYMDVDADTIYPPHYFEMMIEELMKPGVSCVSALWSYFPDKNHSRLGLVLFELCRDLFLWIQHFNRPELSVRGLVFAYNIEYGRQVGYRVDIKRGEDGSMAFGLKKYGKIKFLWNRKARAITGYGTLNERSLMYSLRNRIRMQGKNFMRVFSKTDHYEDTEENLVKP
jgi:glycosyltransferase involved in cell wall biosynthesis